MGFVQFFWNVSGCVHFFWNVWTDGQMTIKVFVFLFVVTILFTLQNIYLVLGEFWTLGTSTVRCPKYLTFISKKYH